MILRPSLPCAYQHSWCRRELAGGFSLLELLVVISSIGVLVMMALPMIQRMNGAAEQAVAQSDARNICTIWNAAITAGYTNDAITTEDQVIQAVGSMAGLQPAGGPYAGQIFRVTNIPLAGDGYDRMRYYLQYDQDTKICTYHGDGSAPK